MPFGVDRSLRNGVWVAPALATVNRGRLQTQPGKAERYFRTTVLVCRRIRFSEAVTPSLRINSRLRRQGPGESPAYLAASSIFSRAMIRFTVVQQPGSRLSPKSHPHIGMLLIARRREHFSRCEKSSCHGQWSRRIPGIRAGCLESIREFDCRSRKESRSVGSKHIVQLEESTKRSQR